jgi:hypothetical protein
MNKLAILLLLGLANCSSRPELIREQESNLLGNVSTKQVAVCQVKCFNRANRGIEAVPAVKLFNYLDVGRFTKEVQKCCFDCFRERNEYDDLTERLSNAAD